jgi:hypothetical protein
MPEERLRFQLALALGCTLRELDQRMSSAEFIEWALFFQIAPEIARPEWGIARLCHFTAAMVGAKRPNGEPLRFADFLPDERLWREANPEEADMQDAMKALRQFEALEKRMR